MEGNSPGALSSDRPNLLTTCPEQVLREGQSDRIQTMNVLPTIKQEWSLLVSGGTSAAFLVFGQRWLGDLSHQTWFALMFAWLFTVILLSAFAVVRHARVWPRNWGNREGRLF